MTCPFSKSSKQITHSPFSSVRTSSAKKRETALPNSFSHNFPNTYRYNLIWAWSDTSPGDIQCHQASQIWSRPDIWCLKQKILSFLIELIEQLFPLAHHYVMKSWYVWVNKKRWSQTWLIHQLDVNCWFRCDGFFPGPDIVLLIKSPKSVSFCFGNNHWATVSCNAKFDQRSVFDLLQ